MRLINGQHFNVVNVAGDGNCVFNALSQSLLQTEACAFEFRTQVVRQVCAEWIEVGPLTDKGGGLPFASQDEYGL